MKLSDIVNLLKEETNIEKFKYFLKDEIEVYSKCLQKKGSSCSINLDEDCSYIFKTKDLFQLSNFYLKDELREIELNYIVDALTLAELVTFESEHLFEMLEEMTDPTINGRLTKEKVTKIIHMLLP